MTEGNPNQEQAARAVDGYAARGWPPSRMSTPGRRSDPVPGRPGRLGGAPSSVWAVAVDALARVSVVAAAATRAEELRQDTATALCGAFADWVFVDLIGSGPPRRAVAAVAADPALARTLARLPLGAAPLIAVAMRRQTPVIEATMGNKWLLGRLPDGTPVADVIDARSAAVGPIVTAEGTACGAITIVRTATRPYLRFAELGFLCHIAELTGVAARRLGY